MLNGPPGFSQFRVWNHRAPRQMMMPMPTRPMVNYNYTNSCCNNSGMGSGAWWALGIGGAIGLLPTILSWFGIGGGAKAAQTNTQQTNTGTTDTSRAATLKNLETIYKDKGYTIIDEGGKFYAYKDGNKVAEGTTFEELQAAMPKAPVVSDKAKAQADAMANIKLGSDGAAKGLTVKYDKETGTYTITTKDGTEVYNGKDIAVAQQKITEYEPVKVGEEKVGDLTKEQIAELKEQATAKGNTITDIKYDEDSKQYTVTYTNNGQAKTVTGDLNTIKQTLGIEAKAADEVIVQQQQTGNTGKGSGKFKFPTLPEGYNWKKGHEGKFPNDTKVADILASLKQTYPDLQITEADILAANPNAIKGGKVVDASQLDLPIKNSSKTTTTDSTGKSTTTVKSGQNPRVSTVVDQNGKATEYNVEVLIKTPGTFVRGNEKDEITIQYRYTDAKGNDHTGSITEPCNGRSNEVTKLEAMRKIQEILDKKLEKGASVTIAANPSNKAQAPGGKYKFTVGTKGYTTASSTTSSSNPVADAVNSIPTENRGSRTPQTSTNLQTESKKVPWSTYGASVKLVTANQIAVQSANGTLQTFTDIESAKQWAYQEWASNVAANQVD